MYLILQAEFLFLPARGPKTYTLAYTRRKGRPRGPSKNENPARERGSLQIDSRGIGGAMSAVCPLSRTTLCRGSFGGIIISRSDQLCPPGRPELLEPTRDGPARHGGLSRVAALGGRRPGCDRTAQALSEGKPRAGRSPLHAARKTGSRAGLRMDVQGIKEPRIVVSKRPGLSTRDACPPSLSLGLKKG